MGQIIYRWDLDKTYIKTDFDTVKDLFKTAFQHAEEKENVPGAPSLLKELQKTEDNQIYFISGSPFQMRRVLEKKLRIDGIRWEELVLKPNLENLFHGRFRALREQVGYKLPAMLKDRVKAGKEPREVLFGDDAESDAFIYSLYADIIAGRVDRETVLKILDLVRAPHDNVRMTSDLFKRLQPADAVQKIFIYLDKKSPPRRFEVYGSRLVPIYNYFQAALVLYTSGMMALTSIIRMILDLVFESNYPPDPFANSFQDLMRRGILGTEQAAGIVESIKQNMNVKVIPLPEGFYERLITLLDALKEYVKEPEKESAPVDIDYVALYNKEHEKFIKRRRSMIEKLLDID